MNVAVHGVPLKPGHVRVSVDGHIQPDASVPVPIPGEIEIVRQAVGSQLAWPRDLIILSDVTVCYLHNNVNIFYFYVLDGY